MRQLKAVRGPVEAQLVLEAFAGFILPEFRGAESTDASTNASDSNKGGSASASASATPCKGMGGGVRKSVLKLSPTLVLKAERQVASDDGGVVVKRSHKKQLLGADRSGRGRVPLRSERRQIDKKNHKKNPLLLRRKSTQPLTAARARDTFAARRARALLPASVCAKAIVRGADDVLDTKCRRDRQERRGGKVGARKIHVWPRRAQDLRPGFNDSWNAFQAANSGRQCLPAEWKAARQVRRHSRSLSLPPPFPSPSPSRSLSLPLPLSLSLPPPTLPPSHPLSVSPSFSLSHTLYLSLVLSPSRSCSFFSSLSLSLAPSLFLSAE